MGWRTGANAVPGHFGHRNSEELPRCHEGPANFFFRSSRPRLMLNDQHLIEETLHAQHADAAFCFVGQRVQFSPCTLGHSVFHLLEVPRHLGLEQIQNAADHGIIALEHLLQVIEVVVIRGHGIVRIPGGIPRVYGDSPRKVTDICFMAFSSEGQRILVTGGAGFIGSHTAVALAEAGFEPVVVDDLRNSRHAVLEGLERILCRPVEFHAVDCGDAEAMRPVFERPLHGAIHFAADKAVGESVAQPEKYFANNVGATARLTAMLKANGVPHLVFSSSCTVYGETDDLPVNEGASVKPAASPYGHTKQVCEDLLRYSHAASEGKFGVALLRYFNPIGAHPSAEIGELPLGTPANLVPFLTQSVAGIRPELTVFGDDYPTEDGTCIRDYLHVCDLAEAHVAALKWLGSNPGSFDVFNLGTGKGSSVKQVISAFETATGRTVPHRYGARRPGDVTAIYADASKAKDMLGWCTTRSLEESLADAWRWQEKLAD